MLELRLPAGIGCATVLHACGTGRAAARCVRGAVARHVGRAMTFNQSTTPAAVTAR